MTSRVPYFACCGLAVALASPRANAQELRWRELPLRVSPDRLIAAAGLEPPVERWRLLYDVSARIHPASGGHAEARGRLQAVAAELQDRDATGVTELLVPVPLSPALWREAVLGHPAADAEIVPAILLERKASLCYRALCQLDPTTLLFLERHPGLLRQAAERPEIFALVAGSLRVQGGSVIVPGGGEAAPLWRDVVGAPPTEPEHFLSRLLERDGGRFALLFHAVDGLDAPHQRFALGLATTEPDRRGARFRALAQVFGRLPCWWQADPSSPSRAPFDPAFVLGRVAVSEAGVSLPPVARGFWEAAFAANEPSSATAAPAAGAPVDAAWLGEQIGLLPTPIARTRLRQLAFAQRVFAREASSSQTSILQVVRECDRRPALLLTLERIGIDAPDLYLDVLGAATRIEALGNAVDRAHALAQFEAALAVLDRARHSGVLAATTAQALVGSLARLQPTPLGYWDSYAAWLDDALLPALAAAVGVPRPLGAEEDVWLRAFSGARAESPLPPSFDWEGLPTRADPAAGERRRLDKVRRRQGGNSLDVALSLARLTRSLAAGGAREPELSRLRALPLEASRYPEDEAAPSLKAVIDVAGADRPQALVRLCDAVLADTLVALSYAPHLGPAEGAVLAGASVARRHELGERPFALPHQRTEASAPWHVRGSLLALEVALAPLSLRRISPDLPPRPPACDPSTVAALALSSVLRSPFALRDEDAAAVTTALERGRRRVRALLEDPTDADRLARAAVLDPWRTQALPWLLSHERPALEGFFSLAELLRLGAPPPLPDRAWGLPELALGGGLGLRRPPPSLLSSAHGGDQRELIAAGIEDPLLEVTAQLAARHLPACLMPATLALLTQSIADEGPPELREDPRALARFLRTLPPERFDDYVSGLAGDGPLLPADDDERPLPPAADPAAPGFP